MTYGARNLRRQIQKDLEDDIATKLIDSYLHPIQSIHASADGEHPGAHRRINPKKRPGRSRGAFLIMR